MSDSPQREESRADRIARYKEERRQQLNSQIQARLAGELGRKATPEPHLGSPVGHKNATSFSAISPEGPRTTRTSRLRAAASNCTDIGACKSPGNSSEKPTSSYSSPRSTSKIAETRLDDKDKSSKRKSNLNRSLNSEEIPAQDFLGDDKYNRRRRKVHPTSDSKQQPGTTPSPREDLESDFTASSTQISPVDAAVGATKTTPKKSQLAIHMENARKGISTPTSDIGRIKPSSRNTTRSPTPLDKTHKELNGITKHQRDQTKCNKDNIKHITPDKERKKDIEHKINTNRLNELSALTKETLARVERLTNKGRNSPSRDLPKRTFNTPTRDTKYSKPSSRPSSAEKAGPSILKKKSLEDVASDTPSLQISNSSPVSILKRKISQDDHRPETSTHTPPVTFSPNVKDTSSTNRKQGILKKRRSLDESLVLRRRSCSPEVASKTDSKSILKSQRRSSLEELTMLHSPETQIQGILKRRTSKNEEDADQSFNSPQSILKRRSGASSAGSTANTPHVSITTAVILAAASGAEMVLDSDNVPVRPILKKKSFSDDQSFSDNSDVPKPILKKKHSTDTEDFDERLRPILKPARGSIDREAESYTETETEMKPILKQHRDEASRYKLSFCQDGTSISQGVIRRHQRGSRRSNTICADYTAVVFDSNDDERSSTEKGRPLSVSELVTSFEQSTSISTHTGAIPKKGLLVRSNERYKTQPVTSDEYEASLLYVASPSNEPLSSQYSLNPPSVVSSTSLRLNDLESCPKVSSDSAFQSLLDGLEMEENEAKSAEVSPKSCRPKGGLDQLMKTIANEAKMAKLAKGALEPDRYPKKRPSSSSLERTKGSRHVTQPVTFDEVQEASKLQQDDPSNLSLSERIRVFNQKILMQDKPEPCFAYNKESTRHNVPSITKIPDITYDEGISCNDSGSDSENASGIASSSVMERPPKSGSRLTRSFSARISRSNKSGTESTSESESSGGREVKNILGTDRSNIK
ncbi:hypothetical protein HHI36_020245 [Cryptolaemus montrouzieri]|uniref:Supervillin n=1 Tax=Cryptolaemus montrouzieri TaxID=559131 RepID=A0ABD2NAG0_9CUCU